MSTALEQTAPAKSVVTKLHLPDLSDEMLGDYLLALADQREDLKTIEHAIELELEARMRKCGAREIPHPKFKKIALEDQWSAYTADYDALLAAQQLLRELGRDEDAAKVVKLVPERTTIVPAHHEYGSPVSIAALIRKYGDESDVGKLLAIGLTRAHLGTKLVVRPNAQASQ